MTTSRTGTGNYLRNRRTTIEQAQREGIEHCPRCGTILNYDEPRQPNSAETDHIIPHSQGGTDDRHNLQILCRHCNRQLSNKGKHKPAKPERKQPATRVQW